MNETDLDEFTELLTTLCLLYKMPTSEKLIELYWDVLKYFEWQEVKAAFQFHLCNPDTGQLMPKPADVIRSVRGSSQAQALQAWSKVAHAIRSIGGYSSVVFDDPLIHIVVIEMGGWISLCQTSLKELPFRANEFEKRYAAYVIHPPQQYPKQLIGLEEKQNRLNQQPVKSPLLIGDKACALAVWQQGIKPLFPVQTFDALTAQSSHSFLEPPNHDEKNLFRSNPAAHGSAKKPIEKLSKKH